MPSTETAEETLDLPVFDPGRMTHLYQLRPDGSPSRVGDKALCGHEKHLPGGPSDFEATRECQECNRIYDLIARISAITPRIKL